MTAIFAVALDEEVELEGLEELEPELVPGPAVALALEAASLSSFSLFSLRQSAFLWPFFLQ